MFLLESILQAWHSLRGHKVRTGLTMFGIIWGIASMVILQGMGKSSERLFYREFSKIGKKMVIVWAGQSTSGLAGVKGGEPIRFTMDDVRAIRDHCPDVELVSPQVGIGYLEGKHGSEVLPCDVFGVDQNSQIIRSMDIVRGRFINYADVELSRRVCVLGARVKEKLFGDQEAVGDSIRLAGLTFDVVGVMAEKGDQLSRASNSLDDEQVSIPYTTAQKLFTGSKYFYVIYLQPYTLMQDKAVREDVRQTLGLGHGFSPDDKDALHAFGIVDMINRVEVIGKGMQIFLGIASAITLLIGGIGVMNIMFVSINERIREIGIIKAVGAKKRQVFLQFLVESIFITFIAGSIGVFAGCMACIVIGMFNLPRLVAAPEIDPVIVIISFATMTLVGILSGILPALRAARMQIVEALHSY